MQIDNLAGLLDATILAPTATTEELDALLDFAVEKGCQVCVNESRLGQLATRARQLDDPAHRPLISTVIGFPLGATTTGIKVHSARTVLSVGADEIDMVANTAMLKEGRFESYKSDIQAVAEVVAEFNETHERKRCLKVIIETCYLSDTEKQHAAALISGISRELKLSMFVKTSTGFATPPKGVVKGATVEDVRLLRKECGPYHPESNPVGIKASGGIKSREDAETMIEAACSLNPERISPYSVRIGTSSAAQILE